ncbi:transporter substrate-binding domain-containing protein [Pseudomonas brassicacearum]|uniref:histidine kinase n=1 Tax=Pseudomonas brassicacearum TaxID=930166 RepID=A0A423GNI2_9PSED|nr:transporter substrate-binding domain-containing protein [Pseudomonas brassicacearum]ROM93900.1 histidine kinase [Pseudomonas brassicacearum]
MPRFFITLWLLLTLSPFACSAPIEQLELLSHEPPLYEEPNISHDDWRWLRRKRELVLGTALPDYPPLEISDNTNDYEGITADYIGIIAKSLGVHIKIRRYADRKEALDALTNGKVDLLSSITPAESDARGLLLSKSYAINRPTLVARIGDAPPLNENLKGQRLAIRRDSTRKNDAEAHYPHAIIKTYDSEESAMTAVAFGQADVLLSDAISAQYLISKAYSSYVRVIYTGEPTPPGFSFAVRKEDQRLQYLLNAVLETIPKEQALSIRRRWGDKLMFSLEKAELSDAEQLWIKQHPTVRIAVSRYLAPLSYFDANDNYLGITSELLSIIETKTGLKFEIEPFSNVSQMYEAIRLNKVQIAADLTRNQKRSASLFFTRPYLFSPFLLITRDQPGQPENLDAMSGKTLSIFAGHTLEPYLREYYPRIHLLNSENVLESLAMLKNGKSDATIQSEILANYNLPRMNEDKLKVASSLDSRRSLSAFAVRRDEVELYGILEKTLRGVSPDALNELYSHWRTHAAIAPPSWLDYDDLIFLIIAGYATLLLIGLIWGAHMRSSANQRKKAARALSNQIQLMEALIDGTPHPIYIRDLDRRLLICNDSYLQAFAADRESLIGKRIYESPLEEAASFDVDYQKILAGGEPLLQDREVHINGQRLSIYHWVLPFGNAEGDIQGIIGGWLDISERDLLLEQLRQSKEDADQASHAKTTFLATMSHEIRTPMSAVIGMLELTLKRADKGHLDRPSIEVAYRSARSMLDLIGDILDIARIESGRLSLSPERANLRELLETVIRVFDGLARQKNLLLQLEIDNSANCDVLVDPLRFKQILSNLISNAIKFTEHGTIRVTVVAQPINTVQLQVQLSIKDTGIGISPQDQQKLFQPFTQLSGNGQHARSGTGLGLVISKTLCEMMGGHLTLESEPGTGTRILIELHLNILETLATPLVRSADLPFSSQKQPLHILVVDDNQANRQLLCEQLKFLDYSVRQAQEGAEGFRVWQDEVFDLVITDCNMPILSGYDLARQIRKTEQEQQRPRTAIFGFTANVQPDEHERCHKAGMDRCIFKPIEMATLDRHLRFLSPPLSPSCPPKKFDVKELDHLTGGDPQVIHRVLEGLLESNKHDLTQLRHVLASGGNKGIPELAHRIKGAARIIKAHTLITHCEQLEQANRKSAAGSQIKTILTRLELAMIELESDLLSLISPP